MRDVTEPRLPLWIKALLFGSAACYAFALAMLFLDAIGVQFR